MAFTADDIDRLKQALASGTNRVRYADGREVQYRSLKEMRELLQMMQDDIASSSSNGRPSRSFVAAF